MNATLSRHDLVYDEFPRQWQDGLPLGNGSIGAVIWGDEQVLNVTLDSCELWDLRSPPINDPRYSYAHFKDLYRSGRIGEIKDIFNFRRTAIVPSRLPCPRVEIATGAVATRFAARLRLASGRAEGRLATDAGALRWRAFLAPADDILAIEFDGPAAGGVEFRIRLDHWNAEAKADLRKRGFRRPQRGPGWCYQPIPQNGGYLAASRLVRRSSGGGILLLTLVKGRARPDLLRTATQRLEAAQNGLAAMGRANDAWWRQYWRRSSISIPDKALEALYYAEMYKLGCNARRTAPLPVALQGVWSSDGQLPGWHGDYHNDLNVQFNYLPVYAANRLDAAAPFYEWASRLLPAFRAYCREFYACDGAFVPCALGPNGERVYGYETCEQWPGNGAWLAHLFWLHYLYSHDEEFLREKAYPFMRECMSLYANILEKGDDGLYHLPLSSSPEYGEDRPEAWGQDTAGDLALIRFLAQSLLCAVGKLNIDESQGDRWRDILEHLAPYPSAATATPRRLEGLEAAIMGEAIGVRDDRIAVLSDALFVRKDMPYAFSHRHLTHLMSIYPLGVLTIEDGPEARRTIEDSIRLLWVYGSGSWVGHATIWAAGLAARARMPAAAARLLHDFARYYLSANSFHMNADLAGAGVSRYCWPVLTLETGFAASAVIMEMLLQSWGDKIRLFPSVPAEWTDAAFSDLRAEGAFLVSACRRAGQVVWVRVHSEKGSACRIENPFGAAKVTLEDAQSGRRRLVRGGTIEFTTRPDEDWLLYVERPSKAVIESPVVAGGWGTPNPYGVKRRRTQ